MVLRVISNRLARRRGDARWPAIDHSAFLYEHLAQARPDLMRELLTTFINALLSAQADTVCGGFDLRKRVVGQQGLEPWTDGL